MIYFTGDIHGRPKKIGDYCKKTGCTQDDIIVILGDVGANYFRNARDAIVKDTLNALGPTIFCVHGNHEQRPANIPGYELQTWNGGQVWVQREYPNLLFARDGDIFEINGLRYLVIGDAYSVDKYYRLSIGAGWWPDEQPSAAIKEYVERQVADKQVDVILSHTSLPINLDISVNGAKYKLVHSVPVEYFNENKKWKYLDEVQYSVWDRGFHFDELPGTYTMIFGHTPTCFLHTQETLSIWRSENNLAIGIDCGSGFEDKPTKWDPTQGRLACLRLDDMKEFYSTEGNEV